MTEKLGLTKSAGLPLEMFTRDEYGVLRSALRITPGVVLNITEDGPELTSADEWNLEPTYGYNGARLMKMVRRKKENQLDPVVVLTEYFKNDAPVSYEDEIECEEESLAMSEGVIKILSDNPDVAWKILEKAGAVGQSGEYCSVHGIFGVCDVVDNQDHEIVPIWMRVDG